MGPYDNLIASYGGKPNGRPAGAVDSFQRQRILPPQVPQQNVGPTIGGAIGAGGSPAAPSPWQSLVKAPLVQAPGMTIPGLNRPLTIPPPTPIGQVQQVGSIPGGMPGGGGVNPAPVSPVYQTHVQALQDSQKAHINALQKAHDTNLQQSQAIPGMSPRYNKLAQGY